MCKCMLQASNGRSTEVSEFLFLMYSSSVFLMLFKVNAVNCNTSWKISLFLAYEDDSEKVLKGVRCFFIMTVALGVARTSQQLRFVICFRGMLSGCFMQSKKNSLLVMTTRRSLMSS